jgi:hypothetical protein
MEVTGIESKLGGDEAIKKMDWYLFGGPERAEYGRVVKGEEEDGMSTSARILSTTSSGTASIISDQVFDYKSS